MSCDAIALSAMLWFAAASPQAAPPVAAPAVATAPTSALAQEPLFADIVGRAGALKGQVEAWKGKSVLDGFDGFKVKLGELAELDMKGHRLLAERGTDGDLKCILRGIAEDLPVRLKDVETAGDQAARDNALREMVYLLRDNVEVITTPPSVTSGTQGL
ncbi:hypothetical protein [Caulobacter mirabilis]|uniref:Uncharacterized protein n=1 Tax=Caulobacter mirabilis TaxID=69666 RepID=A0A2D2ATG2_9CAUL|nr:hypothetical protein [Caulobacter mirabilis]ATQ41255.1 hypothetical protein CSW64_01940 [Caulobacter mirabilis]